MIGIVSYGGYIPRLRLDRMAIFQAMGWFAPAIVMVAQGERSFCNWDEDSLTMAVSAGQDCIKGLDKQTIDALYLCSTTLPFADRLNAGVVKTALNCKDNTITADLTSGLRAGTTGLISALSSVGQGDVRNALVVASDKRETKGAYFYEMWFGDGAAALTVGSENVIAEYKGSYTVSHDFIDHYRGAQKKYDYMWEERWVRDEGYSKIIPEAVEGLFSKLSISMDDVDKFVFPCFFKAEHRKIATKLGAGPEKVVDNMHEVCGETGAAHPLVMLVQTLEQAEPGDRILVAGFGQGCDALYFQVTENIRNLPERIGISGCLENKNTTDNYAKFLKFRDLIKTEMGIRAECPTQTAMTVLWRQRKMLTGMVGGKCSACGTPQFPALDTCVNPDCKAVGTQEDYEFANEPARVKSFTGDLLAVSIDPPAVYGMVEFENGGRYMADFTDCELDDVKVGQPVKLAFRKRYHDEERGFTGYFWKAVPLPVPVEEGPAEDEIRFDGKVAIVTGAGAGLGRAYALELAKRGAKVVVNDLGVARDGTGTSEKSAADKVVDEIKVLGGEATADYNSVATPEGGEAVVRTAIDAYGKVDILVNNAGILRDKTLAKMEPAEWEAVRSVHLDGAYHVTRPAFQKMRENGHGRIVMTTSAAGLYGNFGQTNYSAAKMGAVGIMNTLKLEGEKYDIRVNTIAPIAATRLTEDILPPDLQQKLLPEFVAPMVVYLCSDECQENGMVFNVGMGCFNRAAIVTGPGAIVGDGKTPPLPEDIHRAWDKIDDISGGEESYNATVALGAMLDAFSPQPKKTEEAEAPVEASVAQVFDRICESFQADKAAGVNVVFQFSISGPDGGEWNVIVKDGTCSSAPGKHDSPTTVIKMSDTDFLSLVKGQLNAMKAYTTGKLKIEGDLMKSQLIEKLFKF
jgi:3-hydroxy-3-methylglutaryl CoA synthase/NAD(P)-dependent dehydrogenase (short-subunit alcohol dehydrogenase family)/putative sterol carrier protein